MKYLLFCFLLLLSKHGEAQKQIDYRIDSSFSIKIPDTYKKYDTLGKKVIVSELNSNKLLIITTPLTGENSMKLSKLSDLTEAYRGMVDAASKEGKYKLLTEAVVKKSNLLINTFVAEADINGISYNIECVGLILNNNTYLIAVYKPITLNEYSNTEILDLLSFAPNLSLKNQLNTTENTVLYNQGYAIGQVLGFVIVLSIFISIILWIKKRFFK